MPERGARQAFLIRLVDHAMLRALVPPARPLLDHIPTVDHQDVFDGRHGQPLGLGLGPHLEAFLPGLLQQHGDAAEIGVRAHAELARLGGARGRVADHLHLHDGPLGEDVEDGGRVAEPLQEDLPDGAPQGAGVLVVGPDGGVEGFFGEVGRPLVGAIEAGGLDDGVFSADVKGLVGFDLSLTSRSSVICMRLRGGGLLLPLWNRDEHHPLGANHRMLHTLDGRGS